MSYSSSNHFFLFFFFCEIIQKVRRRIEKNSLVSRLFPRGIYCSLSSICHLKRTVWVNRPSTSFRQVTLESKGAPRRVKSSENSEWIATTKSFLRPKCPLQRSIDDDSLDLEWISRFSSRLEVPCFFCREKIREDTRKGTCKKKRWRYDETIIHGHIQMQLLKSGVLKRSQRKNNKNKIFEWITIRK